MLPEQRAERIVELERAIGRSWARFWAIEHVGVILPFGAACLLYFVGRLSETALWVACGVAIAIVASLTLWWVFRRIRPLQQELDTLRELSGQPPASELWES